MVIADVKEPSDEPLEFPESPAPYVDNAERIGHLSEVDWLTKNPVLEDDDEVEVDQLESEQEEEPGYGSDPASVLTFVNTNPESFNPSQKQKSIGYWVVWAKTPAEKKTDKTSKTPTIMFISKGPFKMNMSKSFETFKREVAEVLPCQTSMLPVAKFEWKFDNQAQSAHHKKIANRAGYEALIDAINANLPKTKRTGILVILTMSRNLLTLTKKLLLGHINHSLYEQYILRIDSSAARKADKSAPPLSVHFAHEKKLKVPSYVPPTLNAPPAVFGQYYQQCQEETAFSNQAPAPPVPPQAATAPPPFPVPRGFLLQFIHMGISPISHHLICRLHIWVAIPILHLMDPVLLPTINLSLV
ncbi:hypothetical protein BDR06DRAFT_975893 [Suillus hirtellus]|nr:hypothetical protein BDR06DRAFT_975893 [Suillus hirtellus]